MLHIPYSRKFSRVNIFADSVDADFRTLKFLRMATPMTTPSNYCTGSRLRVS